MAETSKDKTPVKDDEKLADKVPVWGKKVEQEKGKTETKNEKPKTSAELKAKRQKEFESKKEPLDKARKELEEKKKAIKDMGIDVDAVYPENDGENKGAQEYFLEGSLKDAINQKEKKENEALLVLGKNYDADIQDAVKDIEFEKMDPATRKALQETSLEKSVKVENLPKEIKEEALRGVKGEEGKDVNITNLTPDQIKIVQKYQTARYLEALSQISDEDKNNPLKFKEKMTELEIQNPGVTDFIGQKNITLFSEKGFFEAAKKDPSLLNDVIVSIKEYGMSATGIDPKSELGKTLRQIGEKNVVDYFSTTNSQNLKDITKFSQGLYVDILADPNFTLSETLQESRQAILSVIRSGEFWDTSSPEDLEKVIQEATGLWKKEIEWIWHWMSWTRDQLHPFLRGLMDLFAPLWVAMENAGKIKGNRWHLYAQEKNGKDSGSNSWEEEFAGVESLGTVPGEKFAAQAATYLWKPYEWGNEFENGGGGDCSGLVVRTLRDLGCMGGSRPTAAGFRHMSQEVWEKDGQVWDFLIRESGSGATHIEIIEKNNGDGTYDTIEAKWKKYWTIRSPSVRAGGNMGVYKNPFLSENAQYAGKLSKWGRGKEQGYNSDFQENRDYVPNPQDIAGVQVDLWPIQSWEGTDYLLNYPGSAESGFTLGHGYDLNFYSHGTIERDWGPYMTPEMIQIMKDASGKNYSESGARNIQEKMNQLPWGFADFKKRVDTHKADVLKNSTLPRFIAETKAIYPQIVNLDPKAQTALVSLVYNRWSGKLDSPKRVEMRDIQRHLSALDSYKRHGKVKEFYNKLAGLFEHMNQTRSDWPSGLKRRRWEEAALIRQCAAFKPADEVTKPVEKGDKPAGD